MLFFYNAVSILNKTFSTLLGIRTEQETEEKQGEGQDKDNGENGGNTFSDKWNWVYQVKQVSDMVHSSWREVFEMNIVEFLNILSFIKDYNRESERVNRERMNKLKH